MMVPQPLDLGDCHLAEAVLLMLYPLAKKNRATGFGKRRQQIAVPTLVAFCSRAFPLPWLAFHLSRVAQLLTQPFARVVKVVCWMEIVARLAITILSVPFRVSLVCRKLQTKRNIVTSILTAAQTDHFGVDK